MVSVLRELPKQQRVARKPSHTFQLRNLPYQIQPFMIAPVLPGETMDNLLLQARVVTDPIKNPLIGWWTEYYFFYVKLRDLDDRATFTEMMLTPNYILGPLEAAANRQTNHFGGAIDWAQKCLQRVVEEYFRNEDESWNTYMLSGLPQASINQESYLNSVIQASDYVVGDTSLVVGGDDTIKGSEVSKLLEMYTFQREHLLTNQTFDDYLATFGIKQQAEESHVPELIRYVRDWSYPSNTIDPSTGTPSSAVSWSVQERADKARFFKEPGFIFGVTTCRPKVYLKNSTGNAADLLDDAISWLPAIMHADPRTSLKQIADNKGPLASDADTTGYIVDLKDLFVYGDQFVNFDLASTDAGLVALPTTAMQKRYVPLADIQALFKGATDATRLVRQDGVVSMNIRGTIVDTSSSIGL